MADGLGRYGDPLDPYGDLRAMRTAWRALRPGGRLLLTVPIGPDLVVWNLHRRYGPLRLPRLLRGWEQMELHGWDGDAEALRTPADHRRRREALWVLRRNGSEELPGNPEEEEEEEEEEGGAGEEEEEEEEEGGEEEAAAEKGGALHGTGTSTGDDALTAHSRRGSADVPGEGRVDGAGAGSSASCASSAK